MRLLAGLALAATLAPSAWAQQPSSRPSPRSAVPLTREEAVDAALVRGARLGLARADTAVAFAGLLAARARPNPVLASSYSKSTPQYHVSLELPLDLPGIRQARVGSAQAARRAAQLRFAYERAAIALDADTTYTRALAALARARLSRRNAEDADSLLRIAVARRDAGDASDLDVELATVNAGQQENAAAGDSLTAIATLLDLQTVIGLAGARGVVVVPTDSLAPPPSAAAAPDAAAARDAGGPPTLPVAAAEASLASAQLAARLQRRSVFAAPALSAGFETGDPTGDEPGVLPTVGISLPLPLLDRNRGPILQAEAERERARAELALARLETQARVERTARERATALARVERDRRLVASADRVAAMSLTAYREGESPLSSVLEAQRNAREVLAQYVDDVAAAWIATATLRVYTLTSDAPR